MLDPNNPQDLRSLEKVRNIVKEILDFGVSEYEKIKIIQTLSLELEDTDLMRIIHSHLNSEQEEVQPKKESLLLK